MMYQINGMPISWAGAPKLVLDWLKQIKIEGEKRGNKILFKIEAIKEKLRELRVPHVADFFETEKIGDLEFAETDCIEEIN